MDTARDQEANTALQLRMQARERSESESLNDSESSLRSASLRSASPEVPYVAETEMNIAEGSVHELEGVLARSTFHSLRAYVELPVDDVQDLHSFPGSPPNEHAPTPAALLEPQLDSGKQYVRIKYHESSNKSEDILTLDEYLLTSSAKIYDVTEEITKTWWHPFKSSADFTFAEWTSSKGHSKQDFNRLQKLVDSEWSNHGSKISFKSYSEFEKTLEHAKSMTTKVIYSIMVNSTNQCAFSFVR